MLYQTLLLASSSGDSTFDRSFNSPEQTHTVPPENISLQYLTNWKVPKFNDDTSQSASEIFTFYRYMAAKDVQLFQKVTKHSPVNFAWEDIDLSFCSDQCQVNKTLKESYAGRT